MLITRRILRVGNLYKERQSTRSFGNNMIYTQWFVLWSTELYFKYLIFRSHDSLLNFGSRITGINPAVQKINDVTYVTTKEYNL